ncbi:MAG: putative peptidoglycan glycosyltransferase FtsW [Candidatus Paceibacterota bacterium]
MPSKKPKQWDSLFFWLVLTLVFFGFLIFISASLGLFAQTETSFGSIAFRQFLIGIVFGFGFLWGVSHIPYTYWKRFAVPFFLLSLGATLLVFVPSIGFTYNGATRWLDIFGVSFQPVELLKIGVVVCLAAWFAHTGDKIRTFKYGVLPFIFILALVAGVLFAQPDTGSFLVIGMTAAAVFVAAGARWTHILGIGSLGGIGLTALVYSRPYLQERLITFINPAVDPLAGGYQIKQSLIAVGSGEWFGRGLGQSIQKFNYVPEPLGDSIFSVFAEEWGFIGSVILISLFVAMALRGYKIAVNCKDTFGQLLVVGLVTAIAAQSFVNIAALIGVIPLTGLPLIFVSQGGSALLMALVSVGIILNVSRYSSK